MAAVAEDISRVEHLRSQTTRWALLFALVSVTSGCLSDEELEEAPSTSTSGSESNIDSTAEERSDQTGDLSTSESSGGLVSSMETLASNDQAALVSSMANNGSGEVGAFVGMTAAHNAVRAGLDLSDPMPDLVWDVALSDYAQQWSDDLATRCGSIEHRNQNSYGENIAIAGSRPQAIRFPPEQAVDGWAAEVACWEFGEISSSTGGSQSAGQESCDLSCTDALFASGCGHYTQLVWRNTQRVGCGYSTCEVDGWSYGVWVCNYDPPGNFIGQEPY